MIKFNEEKLKKFLKADKTRVTEIFSDQEKLGYLENADFGRLYFNTSPRVHSNPLITGTLLLSSIDFLSHLDKIPNRCFTCLDMIESISIPLSVTCISDYAFCKCSDLISVTIPNSVIYIYRIICFQILQ